MVGGGGGGGRGATHVDKCAARQGVRGVLQGSHSGHSERNNRRDLQGWVDRRTHGRKRGRGRLSACRGWQEGGAKQLGGRAWPSRGPRRSLQRCGCTATPAGVHAPHRRQGGRQAPPPRDAPAKAQPPTQEGALAAPRAWHAGVGVDVSHRRQRAGASLYGHHRLRLHPLLHNVNGAEHHARHGLHTARAAWRGEQRGWVRCLHAVPAWPAEASFTRTHGSTPARSQMHITRPPAARARPWTAFLAGGAHLGGDSGGEVSQEPCILGRHPLAQLVPAAPRRGVRAQRAAKRALTQWNHAWQSLQARHTPAPPAAAAPEPRAGLTSC